MYGCGKHVRLVQHGYPHHRLIEIYHVMSGHDITVRNAHMMLNNQPFIRR